MNTFDAMKNEPHNYFGEAVRTQVMENFCISLTSHLPNSRVEPHAHEKPYLCLLVSGLYNEKNDRTSEVVTTGTALFRGANHEHANHFYDRGGICFNVEINDPEEFMDESGFKLPDAPHPRLGTVDIYNLFISFKRGAAKDTLNILCYESLIKHFDLLPVKGKLDWIRQMKDRIHSDPFEPISLSKLKKEFGLHPGYIVRKFKEKTGYRLSEYLNKVRVEISLAQMMETDDNLTRIALDTGFCDQSHFNRNFRRHFGVSPSNLRRMLKS